MDVGGAGAILPKLLPGGVTVVLPRSPSLNPALNPGFPTVGVRVPDHEFVLSLCAAVGGPIALTSANISNGPNSTSIEVRMIEERLQFTVQCLQLKFKSIKSII